MYVCMYGNAGASVRRFDSLCDGPINILRHEKIFQLIRTVEVVGLSFTQYICMNVCMYACIVKTVLLIDLAAQVQVAVYATEKKEAVPDENREQRHVNLKW